jgi:hypothetical protein
MVVNESIGLSESCDEDEVEKMIIFAVFVSWRRGVASTRTLEEEYEVLRSRVTKRSEGSKGLALYVGCTEVELGGVQYDAVIVLRGGVATSGQLESWFDGNQDGTPVELEVREPGSGVRLEDFLESTQQYCGRGGSTCGERIVVERGDAETQTMVMMERFKGRAKSGGSLRRALERLNGRMETLQKSDSELLTMIGK